MGGFVLVLFWRLPDEPSLLAVLKLERGPWFGTAFRAAALVLFVSIPILSFSGSGILTSPQASTLETSSKGTF